jgi:hypothetical protein
MLILTNQLAKLRYYYNSYINILEYNNRTLFSYTILDIGILILKVL